MYDVDIFYIYLFLSKPH